MPSLLRLFHTPCVVTTRRYDSLQTNECGRGVLPLLDGGTPRGTSHAAGGTPCGTAHAAGGTPSGTTEAAGGTPSGTPDGGTPSLPSTEGGGALFFPIFMDGHSKERSSTKHSKAWPSGGILK